MNCKSPVRRAPDSMSTAMVDRARAVALGAHHGQLYGDRPYIEHLDEVASIVAPYGAAAQVLALLHDALEDTALARSHVVEAFGVFTAQCLDLLTDPPGRSRAERKRAMNAVLVAVVADGAFGVVLVVKAADRLANLRASLRQANHLLLGMYAREHADFRAAVYRSGLAPEIWEELDASLMTSRR